jgi:ribosomal protein S18 acetylase RimI-like enzyme
MNATIRQADLDVAGDRESTLELLNSYSQHPMGSGADLPPDVQQRVVDGLRNHPMTRVFFATVNDQVVGIAVCFVGYSTFKAKPLLNIHDLHVRSEFGRRGIGAALIDAVVDYTRSIDGCAVTLEVRRDNPARTLYTQKGFQTHNEPLPDDAMLFGKRLV